jgi:hypothetical protein
MKELLKIKARLGSISPGKMNSFPISVQKLLEEDVPRLISLTEYALGVLKESAEHFLLVEKIIDTGDSINDVTRNG